MNILVLLIIIAFIPLTIIILIGLIRKGSWQKYKQELVNHYLKNNSNQYSVYIYFFKTAFGKDKH